MKINTCPWEKSTSQVKNTIPYYPFFLITHLVMHLPVTGKIYLHDGNVFALDICLDLYLQPFDRSNDLFFAFCQNRLVFLMLIHVLCIYAYCPFCLFVCFTFPCSYFSNKMKSLILFPGGTKQINLAHRKI